MNQFSSQVNLMFEFDNYEWEYNIPKNSTKINLGCKILGKLHIYKIKTNHMLRWSFVDSNP